MKKLWLCCLLFYAVDVCAQKIDTKKNFEHTLSIQANQLLKQIINLDAGSELVANPYLLNYSLIHNNSRWGIMAGIGYDYVKELDKENPGNHESRTNNFSARIGIARKFNLGEKFYVIGGVDYVTNYLQTKTVATSIVDNISRIDSTLNVSNSIDEGNGGGIQLRLGYDISKTISISTEATLYFMSLTQKDHTMISQSVIWKTSPQNNSFTLAASNAHVARSEFKFEVPVAIFLGIKF